MSLLQQGFFDSFFNMITYDTSDRKLFGGYTWASMGYIPAGRSSLIRTFLDKTDSDKLLMLDWDISYTPQDVYALVDASEPGKIVSGCYVTYLGEDNLLRPCWFEEGEGEAQNLISEVHLGEVIPLATCGMGFTLFHREDLVKIEKAHADDPWPWFGHDLIGENRSGEDLTFCKRARDLGITVWGHGGIELGHTKSKTFVPTDMAIPALARAATPTSTVVREIVRGDKPVVLNVGGGSKQIPIPARYAGYQHVLLDVAPGVDVDLVADARLMPELDPVDAVYCSHNIEHYHAHEVPQVLAGFRRVLKPGGTVELRCPNLAAVMRRFVEDQLDLDDVLYEASCGPIMVRDVIYGYGREIEESGQPYYGHKTGFTVGLLERTLLQAGFEQVHVEADDLELLATAVNP